MSDDNISSQGGMTPGDPARNRFQKLRAWRPIKMIETGAQVALNAIRQTRLPSGPVIARRIIWSVIIGIAGALGAALFSSIWQHFNPAAIDYEVDVHRYDSRKPNFVGDAMPDVDIDLGINGVASQKTNLFGKAVFSNLSSHLARKKGPIRLHKDGFRPYVDYKSSLGNNDSPVVVLAVAEASSAPAPEVKAVNQPSRPESAPPKNNSPLPSEPAQLIKTYSSGLQISGEGGEYSPWYSLCSDPIPGYHVENSYLILTGDRACNAWSECIRDAENTSKTVACWKFRMQGHSEALRLFGPSGSAQAYSTGILTVTLDKD